MAATRISGVKYRHKYTRGERQIVTALPPPAHQRHGRTTLCDRISGSQHQSIPEVILADKEDDSEFEDLEPARRTRPDQHGAIPNGIWVVIGKRLNVLFVYNLEFKLMKLCRDN